MLSLAGATPILLLTALVGVAAPTQGSSEVTTPARSTNVSVQIVNPDVQIAIRVSLDVKVIFDGVPARSSFSNIPTVPAVMGPFALASGSRHSLIAEVPGANTKAQLEWTPQIDGSTWIVIHYYPGRSEPATPPFFTFSLQANPHKLR